MTSEPIHIIGGGMAGSEAAWQAANLGVPVVLHDLAAAMNHADRVIVLQGGRIAADGPPAQALCEEVIEHVWGVRGQWIGPAGARALSV